GEEGTCHDCPNFCWYDGVCDWRETRDCSDCYCGNDRCDHFEIEEGDCPLDCGHCGDAECSAGENAATCPSECASVCGDGVCSTGERALCPFDCPETCGDGTCTIDEQQYCTLD